MPNFEILDEITGGGGNGGGGKKNKFIKSKFFLIAAAGVALLALFMLLRTKSSSNSANTNAVYVPYSKEQEADNSGSFVAVDTVSGMIDEVYTAIDEMQSSNEANYNAIADDFNEYMDKNKEEQETANLAQDAALQRQNVINQMYNNSVAWQYADAAGKQMLSQANETLGKSIGLIKESSTGTWWTKKDDGTYERAYLTAKEQADPQKAVTKYSGD